MSAAPRELLQDRGILVPPSDARALADGLDRLLTDPAFAARLAQEAREWSATTCRPTPWSAGTCAIYRELLESRCAE